MRVPGMLPSSFRPLRGLRKSIPFHVRECRHWYIWQRLPSRGGSRVRGTASFSSYSVLKGRVEGNLETRSVFIGAWLRRRRNYPLLTHPIRRFRISVIAFILWWARSAPVIVVWFKYYFTLIFHGFATKFATQIIYIARLDVVTIQKTNALQTWCVLHQSL